MIPKKKDGFKFNLKIIETNTKIHFVQNLIVSSAALN